MRKEIVDAQEDKFFPKLHYYGKFANIGKALDQKLEITKDLVSMETAGMDAINDVHNVLMIEVFHSFIPTIGIDLNVTIGKKMELLRRRHKWTSSYDEKKYEYLLSLTAKSFNIGLLGQKTRRGEIYDNDGRLISEEPNYNQKEWILGELEWSSAK